MPPTEFTYTSLPRIASKALFLPLPLLVFAFACNLIKKNPAELTYPAKHGKFTVTVEARGTLKAKNSQVVATPRFRRVRPNINWLPPEGTRVKKGDIVVVLKAAEVERDYINAIDEVQIAKADAEKTEAELALERIALESDARNTRAALALSRLQLEKLKFDSPITKEIRQLEISKNELDLEKIQQKLRSNVKIQKEERAKLLLEIKQSQSKLKRSQRYLGQLQLRAPIDGIVTYAENWRGGKIEVGSDVWPGQPLVEIPDVSIMEVDLRLSQNDAQKVKKDQLVEINIASQDNLRLAGKVARVAKVARPYAKDSDVKKVEVVVEIDSSQVNLAPGLTADCKIIIDEMSDVVSLPKECVFDKDSVKVVYVLDETTYTPYAVLIRKHGDDFVVLDSDLTGGEMCALREPGKELVNWPEKLKSPKDDPRHLTLE